MIYRFLCCLLILASGHVIAQDSSAKVGEFKGAPEAPKEPEVPTKYLVIKPYDDTSLVTDLEEQNINKTMLRVATKQTDFHLALSQNFKMQGVKLTVAAMQIRIRQEEDRYFIDAELVNMKNYEVTRHVERKYVKRKDLQREVAVALELLFLKEASEETERDIKKPIKVGRGIKKPPEDTGLDAFKARIMSIKKLLMAQFKKIKARLAKDKTEEEGTEDEDPKKEENPQAPKKGSKKLKDPAVPPRPRQVKRPLEDYSYLGMGMKIHDFNSVYIIDTNTYVPLFNLHYSKGFFFDYDNTSYWLMGFEYGSLTSTYDQEVQPNQNLLGGLGYKFHKFDLQTELILDIESMNFVNITNTGEGFVAGQHNHIWLDANFGFTTILYNYETKINFYYGTLLMGTSNYPQIDSAAFSGSRFGMSFLIFKIYKTMSVKGGFYQMNTAAGTTEPFTITRGTENVTIDEIIVNGSSFDLNMVFTF
jgi:hypothetical protein